MPFLREDRSNMTGWLPMPGCKLRTEFAKRQEVIAASSCRNRANVQSARSTAERRLLTTAPIAKRHEDAKSHFFLGDIAVQPYGSLLRDLLLLGVACQFELKANL